MRSKIPLKVGVKQVIIGGECLGHRPIKVINYILILGFYKVHGINPRLLADRGHSEILVT